MTASHSLFFYGTLMHPEILKRVIGHQGNLLQIAPAILFEYVRHHVKECDYPAILKYDQSNRELYEGRALGREEKCVRGTLVIGLTANDLALLDTFEGDVRPWHVLICIERPMNHHSNRNTIGRVSQFIHSPPLRVWKLPITFRLPLLLFLIFYYLQRKPLPMVRFILPTP